MQAHTVCIGSTKLPLAPVLRVTVSVLDHCCPVHSPLLVHTDRGVGTVVYTSNCTLYMQDTCNASYMVMPILPTLQCICIIHNYCMHCKSSSVVVAVIRVRLLTCDRIAI